MSQGQSTDFSWVIPLLVYNNGHSGGSILKEVIPLDDATAPKGGKVSYWANTYILVANQYLGDCVKGTCFSMNPHEAHST